MTQDDFLKNLFNQPENDKRFNVQKEDLMKAAQLTKDFYDSFVEVGFDEDVALEITLTLLSNMIHQS